MPTEDPVKTTLVERIREARRHARKSKDTQRGGPTRQSQMAAAIGALCFVVACDPSAIEALSVDDEGEDDVSLEEVAGAAALSESNGGATAPEGGAPPPPPFFGDCRLPAVESALVESFDDDGDGALSKEELFAAREAIGLRGPPAPSSSGDPVCAAPDGHGPPPDGGGPPPDGALAGFGPPLGPPPGPPPDGGVSPPVDGRPPRGHPLVHHMRFIYDANEDGALDDDERALLESDLAVRCDVRNEKILSEFDIDDDGALSLDELVASEEARRDAHESAHAEARAATDTDDDGVLSCEEREAAREAMRTEMLTAYDLDEDGALTTEERAVWREDLREKVRADLPLGPPPPR